MNIRMPTMVQISSRRINIYKKDTKQFKQKNKSFPEIGSESINKNYRHHGNKYKMLKVIVYLIFLFFFPVYLFRFSLHRYNSYFTRAWSQLVELFSRKFFRNRKQKFRKNVFQGIPYIFNEMFCGESWFVAFSHTKAAS